MKLSRYFLGITSLLVWGLAVPSARDTPLRPVRIQDITTVEGVRENSLIGYGMVVGLNNSGDRQQTLFPAQTLVNILRKMGVQLSGTLTSMQVRNIAAVFITATLPPFSSPGTRIDVDVSSVGDAKSLEGGVLLLSPLYGADGQTYATAQGSVVLGGYTAGTRTNSVQVNHPTSGRVPGGGLVERDTSVDLAKLSHLALLLRNYDFATSQKVAEVINGRFGQNWARAVDGRRIEIQLPDASRENVSRVLAQIEDLTVGVQEPAKVVVNERTGTIVLGQHVSLSACSILHGNLAIEITTQYQVSQPEALSQGQTAVVPQTTVRAKETAANRVELREGATVQELISGLQGIGATARDIVAILEAIKAAGALQAELEVI
ncbi:MAG TPA: flagellar basal body P-ring protein FlgI [Terriglobia bacterium]|nr:flagellar basal body P-ring protein FlgI [Terriglobia bacterium]